jgi:maltoporin
MSLFIEKTYLKQAVILLLTNGLCALSLNAAAGEATFGSHASLRGGVGVSDGDTQVCFKAPGAGAKYRLGNECENYIRIGPYYRYESEAGGFAYVEVMPRFMGAYGEDFDYRFFEQAFIEAGDFAATGSTKFWLGRRLYDRHDIYLNDYKPLDVYGNAIGVRDVPVGEAKFEYAFFYRDKEPDMPGFSVQDKVIQHTHDARLYDLATPWGGKLLLHFLYQRIEGKQVNAYGADGAPVKFDIHGANGWSAGVVHTQDGFIGGKNKLTLQYATGSARSAGNTAHESNRVIGQLTRATAADALNDARTWRVTDQQVWDNSTWALMAAVLVEAKDSATFDATDKVWVSAGVRPIWYIDEHLRLNFELGHDRVYNEKTANVYLSKATLALGWAQKRGVLERPEFRLYTTFAQWSDSARGAVGGDVFSDSTHGWNVGVQVEHWW